ncbi:hypothetical protein [Actinoplanes sp. NPDC026619]|uniref:hypothetical protein n=1 Tax=Actinoplanes sp. NPDC026619 TaxID=3155798 RepID=UPI0033F209E9
MTITHAPAVIPAAEHLTGFVAVAITFPADPAAHRIERAYLTPDGIARGLPTRFDGKDPFTVEIRPACRPDTDPGGRHYELSVPFALARHAVPCDRPECFGGDLGC